MTGYITLIKAEADQDYHIVLADDAGRTMIVESTHPDCALKSRFKAEIDQVRAALDQSFKGPITKPIKTRKLVTVTGVGFFDHIHGQTGVADNAAELHPVVAFAAGANAAPPEPVTTTVVTSPTPRTDCQRWPRRHWLHHRYHRTCAPYYYTTR